MHKAIAYETQNRGTFFRNLRKYMEFPKKKKKIQRNTHKILCYFCPALAARLPARRDCIMTGAARHESRPAHQNGGLL